MIPHARLIVVAFVTACASARSPTATEATPGVVFPMHLGEGHGDGALGEPPSTASAAPPVPVTPAAPPEPTAPPQTAASDPPDPTPLRQAEQYEYTFRYEQGHVTLVGLRAVRFPKPVVTARHIGRFALELWIGRELVDRVRFNFPLLGSDEPRKGPRPLHEPPTMTAGPFTARVLVPASSRARSARLVDRATREEGRLVWPPEPSAMGGLALGNSAPTASPSPPAPATAPAPPSPLSSSAPAAVRPAP